MAGISSVRVRQLLAVYPDTSRWDYEVLQAYDSGSIVVKLPSTKSPDQALLVKILVKQDQKTGPNGPRDVPQTTNVITQKVDKVGDVVLVARRFFPEVLTPDSFLDWAIEAARQGISVAATPRRFIMDILSGLVQLHSRGVVHGNLRMSRIAGNPSEGFAIHGPSIPHLSKYRDLRYVAPELLSSPHPRPTTSADIFAFFGLALDVLRPFRNSPQHQELAEMDARVRWLKDFFTPITERPSAVALLTLLIDRKIPSEARHFDPLFDHSLSLKRAHPDSFPGSLRTISHYLRRYPETAFAIGGASSADRLHELLTLEQSTRLVYSRKKESLDFLARSRMEYDKADYVETFPPGIDRKWTNAIHRSFFGAVMDDHHDLRNADMIYSESELDQKEIYDQTIALASEARDVLLSENRFFSTQGVIRELGRTGLRLRRSEIITLRRWGLILAIPDHDRWIYPQFQFRNGMLHPLVATSHQRSVERTGMDPSPWTQLTFFSVERGRLGGHALKDVIWSPRWRDEVLDVVENARL